MAISETITPSTRKNSAALVETARPSSAVRAWRRVLLLDVGEDANPIGADGAPIAKQAARARFEHRFIDRVRGDETLDADEARTARQRDGHRRVIRSCQDLNAEPQRRRRSALRGPMTASAATISGLYRSQGDTADRGRVLDYHAVGKLADAYARASATAVSAICSML